MNNRALVFKYFDTVIEYDSMFETDRENVCKVLIMARL